MEPRYRFKIRAVNEDNLTSSATEPELEVIVPAIKPTAPTSLDGHIQRVWSSGLKLGNLLMSDGGIDITSYEYQQQEVRRGLGGVDTYSR